MAYSQLKTSAEPFRILINLRDNRYRCLDLTDPRTTTAARTPVTSVPALSSHQVTAVTNKVNHLLTLSRVAHEEHDFHDFGNSHGQRSESKYTSNVGRTLPVVPSQYLSRVLWGHPTLTFRTSVAQDPKAELRIRPQVEPRGLL